MTPARQPQQQQQFVAGADLKAIEDFIYSTMNHTREWELAENAYQRILTTRSRPHPAPKFNSTELILLAHDEWKRREERKHLHNEQDWISGFINGFLTDPVWARKMVDTIRANAQHLSTKGGEHR
jgi:hypothetical protein